MMTVCGGVNMNCICDLFDNECFWIILIALLIVLCSNSNRNGCGCGCH